MKLTKDELYYVLESLDYQYMQICRFLYSAEAKDEKIAFKKIGDIMSSARKKLLKEYNKYENNIHET